jgi:hypothetical protein
MGVPLMSQNCTFQRLKRYISFCIFYHIFFKSQASLGTHRKHVTPQGAERETSELKVNWWQGSHIDTHMHMHVGCDLICDFIEPATFPWPGMAGLHKALSPTPG